MRWDGGNPVGVRWMNVPRGACLAALAFATLACSGSDRAPFLDRTMNECPAPDASCDITTTDCQRNLFAATACERHQTDVPMPKVRTISLDEYAKESAARASTDPALGRWTPALQLLGLLPSGVSVNQAATGASVDNVAAYYDPEKKDVTVIARGGADLLGNAVELSHEFVHALQDAEVDLQKLEQQWITSTDSSVAVRSLPEGEATVLSTAVVVARGAGRDPRDLLWSKFEGALLDSVLKSIQSSSTPFVTAMLTLPYPIGTAYLAPEWLLDGRSAIDPLYGSPLLSAVDWVDDVPAGGPSEAEPLDCYPTTAPTGFGASDHDAFGLAGTVGLTVSLGEDPTTAWADSTSGWRGDSVVVFESTTGSDVAVAWRVRWATAAAAHGFAAAVQAGAQGASVRVTTADREVQLLAMSDATALDDWSAGMQCGAAADLPSAPTSGAAPTAAIRALHRPAPAAVHAALR